VIWTGPDDAIAAGASNMAAAAVMAMALTVARNDMNYSPRCLDPTR
jgi:hypothetical protein